MYEVLWTRYLGLYVGHSAYAQVLVLAVYLGGMAVGSFAVADLSKRVASPLLWYAGAEALLAALGLAFHLLFVGVTELSYSAVFPALGSAGLVGAVRWGIAAGLILPQAIALGGTFPLMAAALVRADDSRPGRAVARVYLLNTLGGAAGVLLAGFWLIAAFGLPGTSVAAAVLNLAAAGIAARAHRRSPSASDGAPPFSSEASASPATPAHRTRGLVPLLLAVSFGTALASFAYEIAWIRMLSLALGSATHSFEIMLSAFILGLALGAWWIGSRVDRSPDPLRLLGVIQVLMGIAALLSLPIFYALSFDAVAWLVRTLRGDPAGYALFNVARYGLSLMVMLPATLLAGMTLPVIAGTLLRVGEGERSIGRAYGANTVGSVAGAALAGLLALPLLGLKGLLLAGAAVDVVLGILLLGLSWRAGARARGVLVAAIASIVVFAVVGLGVQLDRMVLSSGVYRFGNRPDAGDQVELYYADGRTATVSARLSTREGIISLATNGKSDASVDLRWLVEQRDTLRPRPVELNRDITTQVLSPTVALAHRPDARNVANIGHGSGMSATTFLTSPRLERVVTIEIEPLMVQGSLVFLPVNGPAISDPRSSYVFDDAKSYFSYQRERFDIVFAEPSNPWVSGTANLFTVEFYRRMRDFLADDGILAQWMQLYELNDSLFLSVLAALDQVFPSYRVYLVGDHDVAIVAAANGELDTPDWSVLESESFLRFTAGVPPFRPEHMRSLLLFDRETMRPLLARDVAANSDYRPVLDLGAERTRFEATSASGVFSFAISRVNLAEALREERMAPASYHTVPARGLEPAMLSGRAAWLRSAAAAGGGIVPEEFPQWQSALVALRLLLDLTRGDQRAEWQAWTAAFARSEADIHWGTSGWVDTTFYREVYDFLDRAGAPEPARAAVDLMHGLSLFEWERVAAAADVLVPRVSFGEAWVDPATLLDAAVIANLRTGRPGAARSAIDALAERTGRAADNLRDRLLDAMVAEAGG